jgi:hypothetical protein
VTSALGDVPNLAGAAFRCRLRQVIVCWIACRDTPKSAAASGNTGIRMCIAKVPPAVRATSNQNGAGPRFDNSGAVSQPSQPTASIQRLSLPTATGAEVLREYSTRCKACRVKSRQSLRAVKFDPAEVT